MSKRITESEEVAAAMLALAASFGHVPSHIHRRLAITGWPVGRKLPGSLLVACCMFSDDHQSWGYDAHVTVLLSVN